MENKEKVGRRGFMNKSLLEEAGREREWEGRGGGRVRGKGRECSG